MIQEIFQTLIHLCKHTFIRNLLSRKGRKEKKVVCYECGKPDHKSFECKTEKIINELFTEQPDLKKAFFTQKSSYS